jgi:serine/threonine-protein kinase
VSRGGGRMPLWSRDGTELFFVAADNTLMRVRVEGGDSFRFTSPEKVLNAGYFIPGGTNSRTFDISPDSRRFLMIKPVGPTASDGSGSANLVVVQNWHEELKRLVPTR